MNISENTGCMPARIRPTEEDGKRSLVDHAASKAWDARQVHGRDPVPGLKMDALEAVLNDRRFVRYPVRLVFDAGPLQAGELAYTEAEKAGSPEDGFIVRVHPKFQHDSDALPMLVAYQLVCVNYGEIAGPEAAEAFGAALMGMDVEDYYQELCRMADSL